MNLGPLGRTLAQMPITSTQAQLDAALLQAAQQQRAAQQYANQVKQAAFTNQIAQYTKVPSRFIYDQILDDLKEIVKRGRLYCVVRYGQPLSFIENTISLLEKRRDE